MIYSSKGFAFFLAAAVALISTLILSFFEGVTTNLLLITFVINLSIGFLLIYIVSERKIFREMRKLSKLVNKLRKKEIQEGGKQKRSRLNPYEAIAHDIQTFVDLQQKEIDELKKLEAFRKEFIADVSHELKTPIFAAQGFVHTLLDGAVNDKTVRSKFLKKAARSLDGLDRLVQDLLTLSHIETGQIRMQFEEVDLYALTQEVFEQFEGKSEKKEVSLRIEGPVRKVIVYADRQRIAQVMTNLISNALKHSPEEAEVVVTFTITKKSVVTRVTDFGEGIPKEHLDRIFERFYRVDKSRSREKGGTGLGLAIVKHILEGHKTRAEVESVPGKGSTFSFKLRRVRAEKSQDGKLHRLEEN